MSEAKHTGNYHIGAAAKATGISTHTIRVWERRYSAVRPARTPGGTRVYSEDDVAKLALLKRLTGEGRAISTIANLSLSELRSLEQAYARHSPEIRDIGSLEQKAITGFLRALETLDMEATERVLLETISVLEPLPVVTNVVAPIVREIGARWERGELRIAHEHAAVAALRNLLGSFMRAQPVRPDAPVAAATTLPGEMHELGVLMSAFVATVCGWRVVYLGVDLPVDEILHVLDQSRASLLLLSLVNQRDNATASALEDLRSSLQSNIRLLVGGKSAASYTDIIDPVHIIDDLPTLQQRLTRRS